MLLLFVNQISLSKPNQMLHHNRFSSLSLSLCLFSFMFPVLCLFIAILFKAANPRAIKMAPSRERALKRATKLTMVTVTASMIINPITFQNNKPFSSISYPPRLSSVCLPHAGQGQGQRQGARRGSETEVWGEEQKQEQGHRQLHRQHEAT